MLGLSLALTALGTKGGISDTPDLSSGAMILLGNETNGLAIDFTDLSMVIRDTGTPSNAFSGDPNSKLTYASPSTKYVRNSSGVYVAGTTLRTDHDASGNPLGLLIEPARTNLITGSATMTTGWNTQSFRTDNAGIGPTGENNMVLLKSNVSGPDNGSTAVNVNIPASTCTLSMFVRYFSSPSFMFGLHDGSAWICLTRIHFDGSGNITSKTDFIVTPTVSWEDCGGGLWRVSAVFTGSGTAGFVAAYPETSALTGTGLGTIFSHWQLEAGSSASSPIVTAGSTVTRAEDVVTLAQSAFPWNGGTGTLEVDGIVTTPTTSGSNIKLAPRSGQTHVESYLWVPA